MRRDGFVIFDFDSSIQYKGGSVPNYAEESNGGIPKKIVRLDEKRIELAYARFVYMNAYTSALYSAYSTVQGYARILQAPNDPTNYFVAVNRTEGWSVHDDGSKTFDYPMGERHVTDPETFKCAAALLNKSYEVFGPTGYTIFSLLYMGCYQYSRHQFAPALVLGWSVIEVIQNHIWKNYQRKRDVANGGHTSLGKKRRDILNGRDYTASIISQILSLAGEYDDELLQELDEARKKRNAFAHELAQVNSEETAKTMQLGCKILSRALEERFSLPLGLSFWI